MTDESVGYARHESEAGGGPESADAAEATGIERAPADGAPAGSGPESAEAEVTEATEGGDEPADPGGTPTAPVATDGDEDGKGALAAAVVERLEAIEALVETRIGRVLEVFENKLAYDRSKDLQVDRLHEELQQHRSDLLGRAVRPLVLAVIALHDDIGKMVSALRKKPREALSPEEFLQLLDSLQEDVVLLLDRHGVEAYREEPGRRFDPKRQKVLKTIATGDRETGGTVAESVRPGFEQSGQIVEKERVSVYRFEASQAGTSVVESPRTAGHASEPARDEGGEPSTAAESQHQED